MSPISSLADRLLQAPALTSAKPEETTGMTKPITTWGEWGPCRQGVKHRYSLCNPDDGCTRVQSQLSPCSVEAQTLLYEDSEDWPMFIAIPISTMIIFLAILLCVFCRRRRTFIEYRIQYGTEPGRVIIPSDSSLHMISSLEDRLRGGVPKPPTPVEILLQNLVRIHGQIRFGLRRAVANKDELNMKIYLAHYNKFCQVTGPITIPDRKLIDQGEALTTWFEMRTTLRRENYVKKLLNELLEAIADREEGAIKGILAGLDDFIYVTGMGLTAKQKIIVQRAERFLSEQAHGRRVSEDYEQLKEKLEEACSKDVTNIIELSTALKSYEDFCQDHDGYVLVDCELLERCESIISLRNNEEQHEKLKNDLHDAVEKLDTKQLKDSIQLYETFLHDVKGTVQADQRLLEEAKRKLEIHICEKRLERAIYLRKIKPLQRAIHDAERANVSVRLIEDLKKAKQLLGTLERFQKLKKAILSLDRAVLGELREYDRPPRIIHDVVIAALLILGDAETTTYDWAACRQLCCTVWSQDYPGLFKRIKEFKVAYLAPEIASRVLDIIDKYTENDVKGLSAGPQFLHQWTIGVAEECLLQVNDRPTPAIGKRQADLLASAKALREHHSKGRTRKKKDRNIQSSGQSVYSSESSALSSEARWDYFDIV